MSDVDGVSDTQNDSDVPQESLSAAEEKNQKVEVSSAPVDSKRSNLEDRLRELEELLCEAHRECERKNKECKREQEAHSVLTSQCNNMKDHERMREAYNILKSQYEEELKWHDESLMECKWEEEAHSVLTSQCNNMKESLSEAEEKNQKVEVSSAPVDSKRSNLEDRLRELEELLCEAHRECERKNKECKREQEAHSVLTSQCNNMKECEGQQEAHSVLKSQHEMILTHTKESLKVSLAVAERKCEQVFEFNAQLEKEKSELMYRVHKLGRKVGKLEEMLYDADMTCGAIKQDHERMKEAYNILKSQYEEELKWHDESLMERERERNTHNILRSECNQMKVSLAEAVEKYKQAIECNAQLENKNSDLMYQVNTLQGSVQQLKVELSQTYRKCDMITVESLSEAEEKNQKVEVSSAPVDSKRSNLEDRLRELEELLCEAHRECERKNKECKREQEAHSVLTSQCNNMKECEGQQEAHSVLKSQHEMILTHTKESLKVSLAVAERKCEQVFEFNAQLEKEKSELMYRVHKLGRKVGKLEEMLYDADMTCGAIKQDHERMKEAYNILKSQYEEELKWHDESLMERERERNTHNILRSECNQMKVSLAEAVEKYKQAIECNAQLENKNSDLMYQVNTLQGSVQQLKVELSQTYRKCDMITVECEQEQEIYRMLLSQNDELKKLLNHNEELQKVTLAEAEKKYEQSMESIAQLEKEKSVLMYQLHTMGGSVQLLEQT
ncbi:myosin-1-like isoform X2 [Ictalurus furcatus]|nr:myosin-1-like isoform X2 [Ictalurus furcatus]